VPQDLAALARRVLAPGRLLLVRGGQRRQRVVGSGVGDIRNRLSGGGILDGERAAAGGVDPLSSDEKALRHAVEDGLLAWLRGYRHAARTRVRLK
jgi:hypothetical protein